MESEKEHNFNERMSQWVANQGFWFQLRYSMAGSGSKGAFTFQFLRMGFRLLVFLLIVAAGFGYYLVKRSTTSGFYEEVRTTLKTGLSASEIEVRGVSLVQGQFGISGIASKGDEKTFFTSMDARNIRCKMGFLDGITRQWNPGTVTISRLDLELRAGADDEEEAKMIGDSLFKNFGKIKLSNFEITDASVRWGYSRAISPTSTASLGSVATPEYEFDHTRGSIKNSFLKIVRTENELRFSFKGGEFTQNWLQDLTIVDLVIVCTREGLFFEKAEFRKLQGTVDFSGLKVAGGARPQINGLVKVRNVVLAGILPVPVRNFIEGSMSGDFRVSGSTNSSEGIGFEGGVVLDANDIISLRGRLHLLKALSHIDFSRNYHRIDFREGSFHLKSRSGGIELKDVNLKSSDLTTLEGDLTVRLPTFEEVQAALEKDANSDSAPIFSGENTDVDALEMQNDAEITLKEAVKMTKSKDKKPGQTDSGNSLFNRLDLEMQKRRIEAQTSDRLSRTLLYKGLFRITLPPDAFERAPKLATTLPVDLQSGRIPLTIPIEGSLYEITLKQAEDLYQQARP